MSTKINSLRKEINKLLDDEEIYWGQRAKAHWLKEGNKNTKFFHAQASERRKQNTILRIWDEQGRWCDEKESTAQVAIAHFENIYITDNPTRVEEVTAAIPSRVTNEMNANLTWDFTKEEVSIALKQSHPTKALGPDELNKTNIALIPKTNNPKRMFEFRPISLCNDSFMAAKLDMSKAFDRVEWCFIQRVMERMGFNTRWINWVMQCITIVFYSVLIKWGSVGKYHPN
ncbi:uncharacterized protein LOC115990838 [Quercus lobata]|uniref:uncharacterized protein LOC115990838 n=1 Tax=Quercus lobata TaxID=97700 RepID=UPI00124823A8|nr:uncharacterized protein LOC115990838 [Quercus lobata]